MIAMYVSAVMFVVKSGGVLARMGIIDPVLVVLKSLIWLAEGILASAVLYGLMMLVSTARYGIEESDQRNSILLVAAIGSVAAVVAAWWICGGPFLLPGIRGMQQVAIYIVTTVAAGVAAIGVSWAGLETKPSGGPERIGWALAAGWVLTPCVMMLAMGHSLWALPVAVIPVAVSMISLRRFVDGRKTVTVVETEQVQSADAPQELASLYGTQLGPSWWKSAAMAAICAQATVGLAVAKWMVAASLLLMLASVVVVWRWSAALRLRTAGDRRRPWARTTVWTVLAFVAMLLTQKLAPQLGVSGGPVKDIAKEKDSRKIYFSVVLLQPAKKKQDVRAPQPKGVGLRGVASEPVVIPFDGPYWYFQPPLAAPDNMAHMASGRASEVNIQSTGDASLLMEAHQTLQQPIDLRCCHEIDVRFTNADTRPGLITVALILRDSTAPPPAKHMVLAPQTLASSETTAPALRGPVDDTVRYMLDADARAQGLERFDDITVVFLPQGMRRLSGAKVEVRSFVLVP